MKVAHFEGLEVYLILANVRGAKGGNEVIDGEAHCGGDGMRMKAEGESQLVQSPYSYLRRIRATARSPAFGGTVCLTWLPHTASPATFALTSIPFFSF